MEAGTALVAAPFKRWLPPPDWGVGAHSKHLRNLYVYFWRWATWKVFGDGGAGLQTAADRKGVVCFITVAGFLNGPGFQAMRADLRRTTDRIWIIDCSPEGHQPSVATRVFQGVQQPVCIVLVARTTKPDETAPARVSFHALEAGPREAKFAELLALTLDGHGWTDCAPEWRAPFLPAATGGWATYPALDELFSYDGSGVMPGRTWVIAPDRQSLERRWDTLVRESDPKRKETLFHPHGSEGELGDRHTGKVLSEGLRGHEHRALSVAKDKGKVISPIRYGYRSFDRQWIIPDNRLLNRPNPGLWTTHSPRQLYITALTRHAPTSGPALTFSALMPDHDHYRGSFAGRVFPLWSDVAATKTNVRPELLKMLSEVLGISVAADDIMAYIAAIAAHPSYVERFADDLAQPGLRMPISKDPVLFAEAVRLGRDVIWLHTFGERFAAPAESRPASAPRMPEASRPRIPEGGAIPGSAESMPETVSYDAALGRLHVGAGYVDGVTPAMWAYEVSGKQVLTQWFSYRGRDRTRPMIGDRRPPSPLVDIQPDSWPAEYTTELLNVLNVIGRLVMLEPAQADLLTRVCAGPTLHRDDLAALLLNAAPARSRSGRRNERQGDLLE